ncbi:LOW QUALITY PROTEIN: Small EDRK-rich factor 2 [Plecturocebus cupreus]
MTRGNQGELARQKNMTKQSDSVKGKRRDDGLSAAACKQRDSEIMQQKKANEKKEEPNFVASCPTLWPFACVPGASPTTPAFPPVVLTGPSTDGIPFALSLQRTVYFWIKSYARDFNCTLNVLPSQRGSEAFPKLDVMTEDLQIIMSPDKHYFRFWKFRKFAT